MMKKIVPAILFFAVWAAGLIGCGYFNDPKDPRVRFMNSSDFYMYWGVRLGTAEYYGMLNNGDSTGYIPCRSGTFTPQFLQQDGTWMDAADHMFTLKKGHTYTLNQTGSSWSLMLVLTDD